MSAATWLPIPEFPGYEVSNDGLVRSLPKTCRPFTALITSRLSTKGYVRVNLFRDGRTIQRNVHILVMSAFVGPRPDGLVINHIDGDKTNNAVENLEYCTPLENTRHARTTGLTPYACNAKLSREDVLMIRELYGVEQQKITAKRYGITQSAVSAIQRRIVWKEVA